MQHVSAQNFPSRILTFSPLSSPSSLLLLLLSLQPGLPSHSSLSRPCIHHRCHCRLPFILPSTRTCLRRGLAPLWIRDRQRRSPLKAHIVMPSIKDLRKGLPVDQSMKKRHINSKRGPAPLALWLSGKKSSLGADYLHDSRSSDCHNGDRRAPRLDLGQQNLLLT